jgi:sulfur carrier protein ThiS
MATNIKLKKSSISGRIPTTSDLDYGEIAINYTDGKLYYKNSSNQIKSFIDSAAVANLINNISVSASGVDSNAIFSLIDSAYILARENNVNGRVKLDDYSYTANANQTVFTGVDNNNSILAYTIGNLQVHMNGLLLVEGQDYTATDGISVTLSSGADVGDAVIITAISGDSAYIRSAVNELFLASIIDSAYIQARSVAGTDSSAVINLITNTIDSAYVNDKVNLSAYATQSYVNTEISNLIDGAPNTLNTLNEIAAALNDDDSAFATLNNLINSKSSFDSNDLLQFAYTTYDSSDTLNLIDSGYIQSRVFIDSVTNATDAVTLNGLPGAYYLNYENHTNTPNITAIIDSFADSAFVQSRFKTLSEQSGELIVSGNIIPDTDSTYSIGSENKKFKDIFLSGGTVYIDNLGLSANPDNGTITIGQLDSIGVLNSIGVIATVDSEQVGAIVDSAYLAERLTDFLQTIEITTIVDSAYINARVDAAAGTDSAATISLITSTVDSAYISTRVGTFGRVAVNENTIIADSGQTVFPITYVPEAIQVYLNGILLSNGFDYTASNGSSITLVSAADSGDALVVMAIGSDSTLIQTIVDSDYIQARQTTYSNVSEFTNDAGYLTDALDSAEAIALIATQGYLTNALDSVEVISLVDSAYIQARQTAQDFAYSSLTGAPTNVSSFTNDVGYTTYDSSNFSQQIAAGNYATQSYVTTSVDSAIDDLVNGAPLALDTLNELATALQDDSNALAALTTVVDTKLNTAGVTSLVDSAYVQARQTPQDFAYSSLTGAPTNLSDFTNDTNYLDSTTVTDVIDATYVQANQITYDFLDSAEAIALIATQGYLTNALDSAEVIALITGSDLDMGTNKILYSNVYDSIGALPNASSYHGMFAHVHATGAAYFAHAGSWIQLANNSSIPTNNNQLTNGAGYTTYDSVNTLGLIDSAYINARVDAVAGTDSAATIALIQSTVDSAYVAAREADAGVGSGGLDSAAVLAIIPDGTYRGIRTYEFIADSGQTAFTGTDDNGNTLSFSSSSVVVAINGIIVKGTDYTSSAGTTITLIDGADSGDEITIFNVVAGGIDSQAVTELIDSAYVQARQVDIFRDSAFINNLVDSAYINARVVIPEAGVDSESVINIITADGFSKYDSINAASQIISTIDSAYVQARQSIVGSGGVDSATVFDLIDSAYVTSRQLLNGNVGINENTFFADSGQTTFTVSYIPSALQVTLNGILLSNGNDYTATNGNTVVLTQATDSGDTLIISTFGGDSSRIENVVNIIVDSAYIQARQTPGTDSAAVLALVTSDGFTKYDSADTLGLIDSAYIRQRVSTDQNLNTTDSVEFAKITVAGLSYPIADGTSGQMITTDGSGLLTFDDPAVEAVFVLVKNVSGGPLTKGTPLHQTGIVGSGTIEVVAARADTASLMPAVSILNDSLNDEEEGQAIISGKISGVNTSAFSEGDVVFVGETGGFTNVKPAGESNIIQNLGIITRVDASNGGGVVLGAGRGAATPNLDAGKIFIGNDSDYSSTTTLNTTIVPEGTNLYYTTARHDSDAGVYLTNNSYATQTYVTTAIDNLIDGAPGTLNTLNEIAAALNDDDSAYSTLVTLIGTKTDFDSADATALITSYGYSTYDSTNTLGLVDSAYVQARQTPQDFAYSSLTGTPNVLDSAQITSMLAADSFSIGGTIIGDGKIEIRNGTGSTPSYVDLYCEVSNAHYTRIQSEAHANYSGNVTLTTPTTSGTLALTSDIVDSAAIITLIQANDQQRDSAFVTGIIDSAYIATRTSAGTDSASVIALITSTVDSAYVALREANAGVSSGGANVSLVETTIIADSGQTTFNASYSTDGVAVYLNGILLSNGIDYTADNGSSITLSLGADSGDALVVQNFLGDSARIQNVVDSDYINARVNAVSGTDSAATIALITSTVDSAYVALREANDGLGSGGLDSASIIGLIDSAYVQDRQSPIIAGTSISNYSFVADSGQTTFTGMSYTPGNIIAHLNGILLLDSVDYTANNGSSLILLEAADSADNLTIYSFNPETFGAASYSEVASTGSPTTIQTVANKKYIVDCSQNNVTMTLPPSPVLGDEVKVIDGTGNASTNNIIINRNGNKILGADSDFTLDIDRVAIDLVYYNVSQGWIISGTS